MTLRLILVRGLPGSGKSTLAIKLAKQSNAKHFEADMFFVDRHGDYQYDASKIALAHQWCQSETRKALTIGHSVIVSNTFVKTWEMAFYRELAEKKGAILEIIVCKGCYQNIHGVPEKVIDRMRNDWEE